MAGYQKNIGLKNITPYKGNAKKHNKQQIDNVAESIKQFGFVQPIVVDKDNVIVIGHCRYEAAKKLKLTEVPCVCVEDLDEEQVQKLRLLDNKLNESDWDMELLAEQVPELDFSGFDVDWGFKDDQEDETYTAKINIPQYQITGECPTFKEMLNTEKADELIFEIENAEISEEDKEFLIEAAKRHNKFNYKNIAEYYANADKNVQELMEHSGLVIIDINDAIKNGFAKLSKNLEDIVNER